MITKILIANRAEIAIRVMRTAREMGIQTVAVYSEADADAMHVKTADEAVFIGASEPAASYLNIEKLIDVARQTGANAIHPGYGFLSERAEFAAACRDAGIIFIGPSPEAMQALGAKIEAKQLAESLGVPVTPGLFRPGATNAELHAAAMEIGLPVMLKASAGGGGRGMRVVYDEADIDKQLELASQEALSAFGDGAMMVEKFVERPRHIEVQVIADQHGNVAPFFERECSVQRRHQKLLEESPSPIFINRPTDMWDRMRDSAVKLIRAANYVGAGTIEFMAEPDGSSFYFLELNARLQVEHPVTEGITGLDLVRLQIEVAQGANLQELVPEFLKGDRTLIHGHTIEARIVAEDPAQGFRPSIGKVVGWAEPKGPGIRVDTGFCEGAEVSRFYDSLIAKLIVHGPDRPAALARLRNALLDFHILGVRTNIAFLLEVLDNPTFIEGTADTGWLGREYADWSPEVSIPDELGLIIEAGKPSKVAASNGRKAVAAGPAPTVWDISDGWRVYR